MSPKEKAAGMLDTPATADRKQCPASVSTAQNLSNSDKRLATLRARCALAGVVLHQIENDHGKTVYIVSRWALTRELPDLDAVAAWLDCVTGVRQ